MIGPDGRVRPRSARSLELKGQGIESEEPDGGPDKDDPEEQTDGERGHRSLNKWHVDPPAQGAGADRAGLDFVRVMRCKRIHGKPPPERSARFQSPDGKVRAALERDGRKMAPWRTMLAHNPTGSPP